MRLLTTVLFLLVFALTAVSQDKENKPVSLSSLKIKDKLFSAKYPDVPQEIKEFHARGNFRLKFVIDENGNAKEVKMLSHIIEEINRPLSETIKRYLEKTIKNWQFKALTKNGEKVSYTGVMVIPFCYGSFRRCSY